MLADARVQADRLAPLLRRLAIDDDAVPARTTSRRNQARHERGTHARQRLHALEDVLRPPRTVAERVITRALEVEARRHQRRRAETGALVLQREEAAHE